MLAIILQCCHVKVQANGLSRQHIGSTDCLSSAFMKMRSFVFNVLMCICCLSQACCVINCPHLSR